jgi:hypothetical protein
MSLFFGHKGESTKDYFARIGEGNFMAGVTEAAKRVGKNTLGSRTDNQIKNTQIKNENSEEDKNIF